MLGPVTQIVDSQSRHHQSTEYENNSVAVLSSLRLIFFFCNCGCAAVELLAGSEGSVGFVGDVCKEGPRIVVVVIASLLPFPVLSESLGNDESGCVSVGVGVVTVMVIPCASAANATFGDRWT